NNKEIEFITIDNNDFADLFGNNNDQSSVYDQYTYHICICNFLGYHKKKCRIVDCQKTVTRPL
ncbi:MAG: hypothetical protein J6O99_03425, partial [Methanobrevibacter sp.]|nr:hypothetical protein [Methanobrevibacter sp.]